MTENQILLCTWIIILVLYRVDPSSLEDRFNMLKSQYEDFLKIINNEGKKAD